ncbi:hypothetical protein F7725_025400 [Dissostichus mawsoni]|uniref:Glycosyltransferase 2-like domain-containing protein n=1 Tax=Dissostichus mawsoni TaxID=36200 RepID=A0A7J5XB19_DISMA|nr:hypothetical protein F7725_025400 [Dissostichus mawsoni]
MLQSFQSIGADGQQCDEKIQKTRTILTDQICIYVDLGHKLVNKSEDRWLCTLLMKQGWRVEYNAASDSYTNAPEDFKEFYNQRQRWGPSTMANILDLLGSTTMTIKKNPSMSKPTCSTSSWSWARTLSVLLDIHPNAALVMAVIPPAIFLGISFKIKSDTQIRIAAVMRTLYAYLMMISGLTIIANNLKDQTILTPSSIFLISLALFYIITAIMHPQEIGLVCFGLLYIICIPSAYLLLAIYSMVNRNNAKCSRKLCRRGSAEENILSLEEIVGPQTQPQNSIVEDVRIPEEEQRGAVLHRSDRQIPGASSREQKKQEQMANELKELRNKVHLCSMDYLCLLICNALWLLATFTLQLLENTLFIQVPKINLNLEYTGEYISIDPVSFMFILAFIFLVIIQFLAMLVYTLIHYVAYLDTEPKSEKQLSNSNSLSNRVVVPGVVSLM